MLVDIISRVSYKSACSCKCVSRRWRDLFSRPDHRKKLPQSLAGFFYEGYNSDRFPMTARYFTNVSGKGKPFIHPSLSFLPEYKSLDILDCCSGLLLCRCWKPTDRKTLDYVVCNPTTEKWVVVPSTEWSSKVAVARLGFDLAVSSHFHVFEFIDEEVWGKSWYEQSECLGRIEAVAIYSSKAGVWTHRSVGNGCDAFAIPRYSRAVFLNGILHLAAYDNLVAAFDVEGNNWRLISVPANYANFGLINDVFLSQFRLYFANSTKGSDGFELSVWVLEDCNGEKWTLKHNVSHSQLFGRKLSLSACHYTVIAFHPERDMIFIVYGQNTLMSYDMGRRKLRIIRELGSDCQLDLIETGKTHYFPYVPLFTESLSDGH